MAVLKSDGVDNNADLVFRTNDRIDVTIPSTGGTGLQILGNRNTTNQGYEVRNNFGDATTLSTGYYNVTNENGVILANFVCTLRADGSSQWSWGATPSGSRTTRREEPDILKLDVSADGGGRLIGGGYGAGADSTVSGSYMGRFHSTDYISGRVAFYAGSWRNLSNSEGGWTLRSSGSGILDIGTINTGSSAGTAVTQPSRIRVTGGGDILFHESSGRSASFSTSGGDIVQFYQNRNGSTPYFFYNTAGNFGTFSDIRLKDNITNVDDEVCFNFVKSLVPIEFNWKEGYGNVETRLIGFSAQNILESSITEGQKNAVTNWECYDENDPDCEFLGLADHRLIPSLVGSIKTLIKRIETLEAKVLELEAS